MRRRLVIISVGFVLGLLFSLPMMIVLANITRPNVTKYTGDGAINVIGTPIITPGYRVEFEAFDMTDPFVKKFSVSGLPTNARGRPVFGLSVLSLNQDALDGGSNTFPRQGPTVPTGSIEFTLREEDGETIFDISAPLSHWRSHESNNSRGGVNSFDLYYDSPGGTGHKIPQIDRTIVEPKYLPKNARLVLEIKYVPGESPVIGFGVPYIRVGGYK